MNEKLALRIGFVNVFFAYAVIPILVDFASLNASDFIKNNLDATFILLMVLSAGFSIYFILKCIIHFWKTKYNFFIKFLLIVFAFIAYLIPMLIYYIFKIEQTQRYTVT